MSKPKINKEQYDEIVKLYQNGLFQKEIAEMYGVSRGVIGNILRNCNASELNSNYKSRKINFTEDEREYICREYIGGKTSVKLSQEFHCDHKTINKLLDEYGIKRRIGGTRKYELNEHYFDEIDTPNKAYIFGFFLADGSNIESKRTISISLQEEDRYILEKIRNEIGSERPLEFLDYSNKHDGGYNYKNQYRLLMFSKHMCLTLKEKGMPQNKSLILKWPTFLQDDLYSHLLRGYIDGDGYIQPHKWEHCVSILGTYDFCSHAKDYIENKLNIKCRLDDAPCYNGITTYLYIRYKDQVKKFLDWIYQDADLKLDRKYNTYISKYCLEENINDTLTA